LCVIKEFIATECVQMSIHLSDCSAFACAHNRKGCVICALAFWFEHAKFQGLRHQSFWFHSQRYMCDKNALQSTMSVRGLSLLFSLIKFWGISTEKLLIFNRLRVSPKIDNFFHIFIQLSPIDIMIRYWILKILI